MIFYVAYSAEARQDLRDIYEYAYELLVPETAAGQWLHCSER
jgi:plasmid stabilization system protein ParE